jgi:hypothetical protein
VKRETMANREQRLVGKRRQEDWMEEDDLLDEDVRNEQDLRRQVQHGPRFQGEGDRGGYKGRRIDNYGFRGSDQIERIPERGKRAIFNRNEEQRLPSQQGS